MYPSSHRYLTVRVWLRFGSDLLPTGLSESVSYITLGPRRVSVSGDKRIDAQMRLEYGGFHAL